MVFYCERAAGFDKEHSLQDSGYFDALVRMFEQALKGSATLPARQRDAMLNRLDAVRRSSHNFGYGVGYALDDLLSKLWSDVTEHPSGAAFGARGGPEDVRPA